MKLTGAKLDKDIFKFYDSHIININKIYDVLVGNLSGCIFRNMIDESTRDKISKNFWENANLKKRTDGVPGSYLGTYHYKKNLDTYLDESYIVNKTLDHVFTGTGHIFNEIMSGIEINLKEKNPKSIVRPAKHNKKEACRFFVRSWFGSDHDDYALAPHDDISQCTATNQRGFEIQSVVEHPVVAVNLCVENQGGGELHYWNIQADNKSKAMLGVEETGYPYPLKMLDDIERLEIKIHPGDVYFFNGTNIHAVSSPANSASFRTTISCLMGFINEREVIYWT